MVTAMAGDLANGLVRNIEAGLALVALLGAVWLLLRKIWRGVKKASHVVDDVLPQVRRALADIIGDEANPGVVDRLGALEDNQSEIRAELLPNGGSTLRDGLNRLEASVAEVKDLAGSAASVAANAKSTLSEADQRGSAERRQMRESLEAIMTAFEYFAKETRMREVAYVQALAVHGIDLTGAADAVEDQL